MRSTGAPVRFTTVSVTVKISFSCTDGSTTPHTEKRESEDMTCETDV